MLWEVKGEGKGGGKTSLFFIVFFFFRARGCHAGQKCVWTREEVGSSARIDGRLRRDERTWRGGCRRHRCHCCFFFSET